MLTMNLMNSEMEREAKSPHYDFEEYVQLCEGQGIYDDLAGEQLEEDRAIAARKLEMDLFNIIEVYSKVLRSMAIKMGAAIIAARWVDASSGDTDDPDYRSRSAGMGLREIKYLISLLPHHHSNQHG